MTWRDSLRKASWKGVDFWWKDASTTLDPFVVTHKYPQRKGGWSEPLGLGPDEFEIVGFVLGDDYMAARDALIRVSKEGGPGTLVHPTLGEKRVVIKPPVRFQESTAEGGICRFTFTFVEEGENKAPSVSVLDLGKVGMAAVGAQTAVVGDFETDFQTMGLDLVESDAAAALAEIGGLISNAFGMWSGGLSGLTALMAQPLSAIRDAKGLASSLSGLFAGFKTSGTPETVAGETLAGLGAVASGLKVTPGGTSPQDVNRAALATLVRRQAAIAAAETAAAASYSSRDDALVARDQAAGMLDQVRVESATRGATFTALTDLRAAMVRAVGEKAGTLASVRKVTVGQSQPSVMLAYRELGDGARADEIVARNRSQVWNPLFVPSGSSIEVLDG